MAIELINKNHGLEIRRIFDSAKNRILIISPFLGRATCEQLATHIDKSNLECRIITRFYREDFIQNVSSLQGLQYLLSTGAMIRALIGLHSKLYIVDDIFSIVTSANYTLGGLLTNFELGIKIDNEPEINQACYTYFYDLWNQIEDFNVSNSNRATVTAELINREIEIINKASSTRTKSTENSNCIKQGAELGRSSTADLFESALLNQVHQVDTGETGGWLKFAADAKHRHDPETGYLDGLNPHTADKTFFPNQPIGIKNGDKIYLALVSYDNDHIATPIIIGRASTTGFDKNKKVDKSFVGWQDWMDNYPFYINLTKAEILEGPAKYGISLLDLYRKLKGDIFPSTFGSDVSFEIIRQYHYQKDKIRITKYAAEYIDSELDKIFSRYGVKNIS